MHLTVRVPLLPLAFFPSLPASSRVNGEELTICKHSPHTHLHNTLEGIRHISRSAEFLPALETRSMSSLPYEHFCNDHTPTCCADVLCTGQIGNHRPIIVFTLWSLTTNLRLVKQLLPRQIGVDTTTCKLHHSL